MSAEADIYPNKNFGFRPKSRPVVAFGVKSKIFILFGGAGDPSLWEGSFCLRGYAAQRRAALCKNNRAAIVPKLVARVSRSFIPDQLCSQAFFFGGWDRAGLFFKAGTVFCGSNGSSII